MRSLLRGAAFLLALALAVGAVAVLALERTGTLARLVEERLAAELGTGGRLSIRRVELSWFDPGVHLLDVHFAADPADEDAGYVHFDRIDVDLRLTANPLDATEHVRIGGGSVLYAPELAARLEETFRGDGQERVDRAHRPSLPHLSVEGFDLAIRAPRAERLTLGTVDLGLEMDPLRLFRVSGRFLPAWADGGEPSPIHFSGLEDPKNRFRVRAGADGLPLVAEALPLPVGAAPLPRISFRGRLDLEGEATFHLDGSGPAEGELRARLHGSRAELDTGTTVEDLALDLRAAYGSVPGRDYLYAPAWSVDARAAGRWSGTDVELGVDLQPEGDRARAAAWVHLPALRIDSELLSTVDQWVAIRNDVDALRPRGVVGASIGVRSEWSGEWSMPPEFVVHVQNRGETSAAYHGWPSAITGEPEGIPIPVRELHGDFVLAGRAAPPGAERPVVWRAGLDDLRGRAGPARFRGRGEIRTGSDLGAFLDLDLELRGMPVDERVREGLSGMRATREVWDTYGPSGGVLDTRWRLRADETSPGLAAEGTLRVRAGSATWREIPVPARSVEGEMTFRWAAESVRYRLPSGLPTAYRPGGLTFRFTGETAAGSRVALRGSSREEFSAAGPTPPPPEGRERLAELLLEVEDLPLAGPEWETLAAAVEDAAAQVEFLDARGNVDATYASAVPLAGGPREVATEVRTRELAVAPQAFPLRAEAVRGRVSLLARQAPPGAEGPAPEPRVEWCARGRWERGTEVASWGSPGAVRVAGSGVDPADPELVAAVQAVLSSDGGGVDLSELRLRGELDVLGELDTTPPVEPPRLSFRLRRNDLEMGTLKLADLRGGVAVDGGVLRGERVLMRVGRTDVELRDAVLSSGTLARTWPEADPLVASGAMVPDADAPVLQADVFVVDLPLDREHLEGLAPADGVDVFFERSGLQGRVDLDGTRLLVAGDGAGGTRLAVHGPLLPHGVAFDMGLPARIRSARIVLESLRFEEGGLRAWGSVSDLYGSFAEHELAGARAVLSYVDGRLSLENLDGAFEGGRLSSLGRAGSNNTALRIDLADPFAFDVALRFEDLEVDSVLEGVFPSSVPDTGRLRGQIRLGGTLQDPRGLQGAGWGEINGARLWSIPVVRELFSRLGFDGTAVFDRMSYRFRLRDGVVSFPEIRARSPLLKLVGRDGRVALDGDLDFDLEVRYSLIDRLGPLNQLLYWIQNSLLRVSIRGDMARPRVLLRNGLRELFGSPDLARRSLPLPRPSPLPDRF